MRKSFVTIGVALTLGAAQFASAAPVEFSAAGAQPADIQAAVDAFRAALSSAPHFEINWDGVPDTKAAPNLMPFDQFKARGALFATPGSGFEISAKAGNPTGTPVNFGDLTGGLRNQFQAFSPQRLFTALDSAVTLTQFVVPGSNTLATSNAFGSVFTTIDYLDASGQSLHTQTVPASKRGGLSFAGTFFSQGEKVATVRITSGNVELDPVLGLIPNPRGDDPVDVVVMDDFIYAAPQAQ
jgi:hypothetical protein